MGKRKNSTQPSIKTQMKGKINKGKLLSKKIFSFSTSDTDKFNKDRASQIMRNVQKALKKLQNFGASQNKKRLISALNLTSQKQIVCSTMNIPSIQNMVVSKNSLCSFHDEDNRSQSGVSFNQGLQYCLIQNQPELMLSYLYLVEKAMNNLGIVLSSHQNQKLVKGVWNIITKFWFDDFNDCQYQNLSAKIEWGLLELLNFDLKVGKRQRVLMEVKIKSLSFLHQ